MRACNNLGQLDQRVSNAVKTRQEVDLRIGKERGRGRGRGREMREGEREINLSHFLQVVPSHDSRLGV